MLAPHTIWEVEGGACWGGGGEQGRLLYIDMVCVCVCVCASVCNLHTWMLIIVIVM